MKTPFIVVKKRVLLEVCAFVLCFVTLTLCLTVGNAGGVYFGASLRKVPIYKVATEKKQIALTFDAAWGADKTENILNIFNERNAKGTFFLVSFWVDKYPHLVEKIHKSGFEVGTHSATHSKMSKLSKIQISEELKSSKEKIENITKEKVCVFRPPFGDYNNELITTASENDLYTIQWSIDSLDWKDRTAQEIANKVLLKASSGDIVLFHNDSKHIIEALPIVISGLKTRGFEFVRVSDLIYKDNYFIDSDGIQRSKNN